MTIYLLIQTRAHERFSDEYVCSNTDSLVMISNPCAKMRQLLPVVLNQKKLKYFSDDDLELKLFMPAKDK